ncbi:hypothetical protein [Mycolicibacterium sediminis]|uniref:Transmembrane protein n=1 Tax=Mycolicibacterium sediminis TaxID=1286180 RepID=A0A7I7QKN3_9MYCO|nr:hypothetical protein [Mycolicibacterium sediminis]BBY26426.1 hypothetical protein MSEDJ_05220 [Mycolicibacterium sediminis]
MRRWIAILWHASFLLIAGGLYFFFVLPRWFELLGDWSTTLGTSMRIVCGLLVALAALPVVFTWLRTRKPEYGTPQLALNLRTASIGLHVLAGVLIVGTAVSEIWLNLDDVGQWLFGIYGAAAAVALLGAFAFYLAFAAELPPPPPKPLKSSTQTRRRGRGKATETETDDADESQVDAADTVEVIEADGVAVDETTTETVHASQTATADETEPASDVTAASDEVTTVSDGNAEETADDKDSEENDSEENGKLRNRRPAGKSSSRLFRRSRGGVALDD